MERDAEQVSCVPVPQSLEAIFKVIPQERVQHRFSPRSWKQLWKESTSSPSMSPQFQIWDDKSSKTFLWLQRHSLWNELLKWLLCDSHVHVSFRQRREWDGVLAKMFLFGQ